MLIALAAVDDHKIHQMDVKMVFLNGELVEEIYIEQNKGFVVPGKEEKVCRVVFLEPNKHPYNYMLNFTTQCWQMDSRSMTMKKMFTLKIFRVKKSLFISKLMMC